jgi:hypothetical protein
LASSAVLDLTLEDPPWVDWMKLMLYEPENSMKEDMNRIAYIEKKKKDTDDAEAEKKKAAADALNKEEEDKKARQKLEDGNTVWYKKKKKLFVRKVSTLTNNGWFFEVIYGLMVYDPGTQSAVIL